MRLILLIRINCLKSRDFYNKVLLVWWWLGVRSKFLPCALCDNIYDENIHSFPVWCHIFTLYSAVFEMLRWVKKKKKGWAALILMEAEWNLSGDRDHSDFLSFWSAYLQSRCFSFLWYALNGYDGNSYWPSWCISQICWAMLYFRKKMQCQFLLTCFCSFSPATNLSSHAQSLASLVFSFPCYRLRFWPDSTKFLFKPQVSLSSNLLEIINTVLGFTQHTNKIRILGAGLCLAAVLCMLRFGFV